MKRNQVTSRSNPNKALVDSLLALDRRIVERSLRIYNVPRRERIRIRAQNRRLHSVVREIDLNQKSLAAVAGSAKCTPTISAFIKA
jgi:hypothetical protein